MMAGGGGEEDGGGGRLLGCDLCRDTQEVQLTPVATTGNTFILKSLIS